MFKKINIASKLIMGFLVIASLIAIVSFFAYLELNKLVPSLSREIPDGLAEIDKTARLDALAQKILYLDQILTESARNYARTRNTQWKSRYKRYEPELEDSIKEAIATGDERDKEIFSNIHRAKIGFVKIENEVIKAVDQNSYANPEDPLETPYYWQLKEEYKKGLDAYVERRGKKRGESLEVTSTKVNDIVEKTRSLLQESIRFLIIICFMGIVFAIFFGWLVARAILKPLKELQKGAEVIGRGNLDYQILVDSEDEVAKLATAFNQMTRDLKESYSGLEEKVRSKTRELAQKVDMIQKVNRDLEAAKNKIEQDNVKYEALLASIGDGMLATDAKGVVMIVNHQTEEMLGLTAKQMIGKPINELVRFFDERGIEVAAERRPVSFALSQRRKVLMTGEYVRQDKQKLPVSISVSPIILGGIIIGAIEIFRDITKEKEVERMKNEFISTVSHELRTPLTVIREGVSLVLDKMLGDVTNEQREFLLLSLDNIDRLRRIIDNLLDISKIEAGRLQIKMDFIDLVPIAKNIQMTFSQRAKDAGLEIRTSFSDTSIEVYADKDKLIQVFTNLLGNAFKFTRKGYIEIGIKDIGDTVECYVADTGHGIAKEDLPKVFSKFSQFHRDAGSGEKGTGLGLSIAKGIVELHKGKIWVESQMGQGTQFKFTLPKYRAVELFREYISQNIKESSMNGSVFSILNIGISHLEKVERMFGPAKVASMVQEVEHLLRKGLRRNADMTIKGSHSVFMILPQTSKKDADVVIKRMAPSFDEYLSQEKLGERLEFFYVISSYPEDGLTVDELVDRILSG